MKQCTRLLFGTAGIPHSANPHDSITACHRIAELGLDAMEIEYVRGSFPSSIHCHEIRNAALHHGVRLTAHGPYFINLNADDAQKQEASRERIRRTAYYGGLSGAESVTFHAGFFLGQNPKQVYSRIRDELAQLARYNATLDHPVDICPELTGKPTQFGSLDELLGISSEIAGIRPCIDWSHHHARHGGENSESAFQHVIDSVRDTLGTDALHSMHMHLSGIEFGPKGERKHLNLEDSDMDWRGLITVLKHNDVRGILICESPSIEDDALLLKTYYDSL
jgi:deoxyribonuclease-4